MCKFDNPDCFNCPYEDCTADAKDIQRQWAHGCKEVYIPERIIPSFKPIVLGTSYNKSVRRRQARYDHTEKGMARARRYRKKYTESGKNAEYCRKYRERKKNEANRQG